MPDELTEILLDIRTHLEFCQQNQIQTIELNQIMDEQKKIEVKNLTQNPDQAELLKNLQTDIGNCTRCKLSKERNNIVFGEGSPNADLMFIGEGPGFDEDQQGKPFVGKAGRLLDKIIEAMGLKRDQVYIGNVVKCRPPDNRNPETDEIETCFPFLEKQIKIIEPKVIVCLGKFATQTILKTETAISKLRGQFFDFGNAKLMPTFHPAYLLRNPNMKRQVWEDMQKVMEVLK